MVGPAFFGLPFFPFFAEEEDGVDVSAAAGVFVLAVIAVLSVIAATVIKGLSLTEIE